jgi:hypothetical protein
MNDITKRPETLPADFAKKLMSGIAESRATTTIGGGGKDLLRMLKSGEWVYGQSNEEVQSGSQWVINIMSLAHGWTCWVEGAGNAKNSCRGKLMVSMTEAKPACPPPIDNTPFKELRSFELKCITGEDVGIEVLHEVGSLGGMRAVDGLLAKIQAQLAVDPAHPCPVLILGKDHYDHTKWGRIYTPVYQVIDWSDMNGNITGSPAAAPPLRPLPTEPAATAQTHVGQRRRRPGVHGQEEVPF